MSNPPKKKPSRYFETETNSSNWRKYECKCLLDPGTDRDKCQGDKNQGNTSAMVTGTTGN